MATAKKKKHTRAVSKWIERDITPKVAAIDVDAERDRLLAAVLEAPEDDARRLVYADWLQQKGDPRGEFIAVQCEIARLARALEQENAKAGRDDEVIGRIFGRTLKERKQVEQLRTREDELLKDHKKKWVGRFAGTRTQYGTADRMWVKGTPTKWKFDRGFVSDVTMRAQDLARNAEAILAAEPIEWAHVTDSGVSALAECQAIGKLRGLDLDNRRLKEDGTRALFKARNFTSLERLSLRECGLGTKSTQVLAEAGDPKALPSLRVLYLGGNGLGDRGATILASAKLLQNLRELSLNRNNIHDAGAIALAESPHLDKVEVLDLWGNPITAVGARALRARFGSRLGSVDD